MRILKFVFLAVLFAFVSNMATGQNLSGICGTHHDATIDRLVKNKQIAERKELGFRTGAVIYLPIKFHLVARTNGSGRVLEPRVLEALCHLNEMYRDQDIQFYISGDFNYMNNDQVYTNHRNTVETLMFANRDADAINIFIVNEIDNPGGVQGTILGYYQERSTRNFLIDWIVMRINQINATSQTLPHEMGHYLSLAHPHRGWEPDPFTAGDMGWPVAPIFSPGGPPTEYADGRNCNTAGDMLCDTPADYNGLEWSGCNYQGGAMDPASVLINPDETNVMSYFNDPCYTGFTNNQKDMMAADILTPSRDYIRKGYTPIATEITETVVALSPASNAIVNGYNFVALDWNNVAGAEFYLLEIDIAPAFNISPQRYITNVSYKELTDLQASKRYYWRIKPYNRYYTCAPFSLSYTFNTDNTVAVKTLNSVTNMSIFPNPVSGQNAVTIFVNADKRFEASVFMTDLSGKVIASQKQSFAEGENSINWNLNQVQAGVYFLTLRNEEGVINKRLIVSK